MSKKQETIRNEIYNFLKTRGFSPVSLGSDGKASPVPDDAEVFQFELVQGDKNYGKVYVTIDGLHQLIIYFNDEVANSPKSVPGGLSWEQLLRTLKQFATQRQLSFKLSNQDNLENDMAKREHLKKQEQVYEGYYPQGKKASYNDAVPTVTMRIQHSKVMEEGEKRFRHIEKIFVENQLGERFLLPTNKPGLGRVYARHIAEGGKANDDRWNHIGSLCEEYSKMAGFVRAVRNGQFNESAQQLVNEGVNHYQSLRESLGRLAGHRGYNAYFESWTPPLMEDETDTSNINELFVQETVDPRIESVMPILSKLHKKISEMAEVDELSEWADNLISGGITEEEDSFDPLKHIEKKNQNPAIKQAAKDVDRGDYAARVALNKAGGVPDTRGPVGVTTGMEESEMDTPKSGKPSRQDVAKKMHSILSKSVDKSNMARVKTQQEVGSRVADIGAGGKEHNVKTDAAWDAKEKGLSEDSFDNPVASAITRRILMQRSDLLAKYGPEKVTAAIDDVADFVGDTDEIGSSDVSGWVKQVERELNGGSVSEEVDTGQYDARKSTPKSGPTPEQEKSFREKLRQYSDELGQRQKEKEVSENLDSEQKSAGQFSPKDKFARPGSLVGATESVDPLIRIKHLLGK